MDSLIFSCQLTINVVKTPFQRSLKNDRLKTVRKNLMIHKTNKIKRVTLNEVIYFIGKNPLQDGPSKNKNYIKRISNF